MSLKQIIRKHHNTGKTFRKIKMRCHLNADTLYARIRLDFNRGQDHGAGNSSIVLSDVLMSALAMLCLKDTSLPAVHQRRQEDPDSLHEVFGIGRK